MPIRTTQCSAVNAAPRSSAFEAPRRAGDAAGALWCGQVGGSRGRCWRSPLTRCATGPGRGRRGGLPAQRATRPARRPHRPRRLRPPAGAAGARQEMAVSVWLCGPGSRGRSSTRRVGPDGSSSRSSRLVTRVCELRHARYVRDTGRGWRWSGTGGSVPVTSTPRRRPTRWRPR